MHCMRIVKLTIVAAGVRVARIRSIRLSKPADTHRCAGSAGRQRGHRGAHARRGVV